MDFISAVRLSPPKPPRTDDNPEKGLISERAKCQDASNFPTLSETAKTGFPHQAFPPIIIGPSLLRADWPTIDPPQWKITLPAAKNAALISVCLGLGETKWRPNLNLGDIFLYTECTPLPSGGKHPNEAVAVVGRRHPAIYPSEMIGDVPIDYGLDI
ncbi:hypothetical protein DFH09DRAFT_1076059 [Mycena vulgaris]|nr:hypothetical protein DFH09DRAFT_1096579 [Mycena vulgaris]KAJ6582884.1 hypothetical protein DFH09DRAFT_1076059 [Mycena vulgaris]